MSPPRRPRDRSVPVLAAIAVIVAFLSIWLVLSLQPADAATAENVPARGWSHEGFGRLVFDWPNPVGHEARIEDGQLVVDFERAGTFAFDRALGNLTSYLSNAQVKEGGHRIVFTLVQPVTFKSFTDGPKVVVDLVPAVAAAPSPATAQTAPASPDTRTSASGGIAPGAVRVRAGEHDGFSRVVFDWPQAVPYEITRQGDVALVSFGRSAQLDLGRLASDPPKAIRSVEASTMADRVVARLVLQSGAKLRDFASGASVVIDIELPSAGSLPASAVPASSIPEAPQSPALPSHSPESPAAAPGFASAPPPAAPPQAPGAPVQLVPPITAAQPVQPASEVPAASPAAPAATPAEEAAPAPAAPAPTQAVATSGKDLPVMPVVVELDDDGAKLRVDWPHPVAAAAFRRAGVVWLVFDRPSRLDLQAVIASEHPALGSVSQLEHPSASILQFSGDSVATPRLDADGTAWIIDFRAQAEGPFASLQPRSEMDGSRGGRMLFTVAGPSAPIKIGDPEVGDRLIIVAVAQPGTGMEPGREWPDLALLPTQQGIVVAPRSEDVVVQSSPAGVVVTRSGGLLISREAITAPLSRTASGQAEASANPGSVALDRMLDLVVWRRENMDFVTARQELQRAIVESDETRQNIARLDLARFYFAHGLATESAALIELIARGITDPQHDPELLLLSGASHLLHDDMTTAREELLSRALDGEPEAELWRAALAASAGEWDKASVGFAKTAGLLADYPHVTRARLLLLAAEAEIEGGAPAAAAAPLDVLRNDAPTPDEAAQLAFLEGLKADREGRAEHAQSTWQALTENNHQPTRARAIFQLTELMLRVGKLPIADAIERLERLRFIWRGGPFEFAVMRRLGELYIADGKPREGLTVMRQAVANFPNHRDAQAVTGQMADAFRDLYLGDGAAKVSPLLAAALYDEFRELTPAGAEGDRLIAGLADRLVEVDLLDRAGKLLADQIRYRLRGQERAEAGTRLAEIRLLDRRPDEAIAALRASATPGLPDALTERRTRLQARALYETGRAAEALALLEGDTSREGTAQRADILWHLREWAGAGEALGQLLELTAAGQADRLDERRAGVVLNRAIALTLAGDRPALEQLAGRYGEAIAATSQAEPFKLLTDRVGDDMTTRSVAEQLASASRLEGFLDGYREQIQTASAPPES